MLCLLCNKCVDEKFDWNCESGGKHTVFIKSSSTYFRLWGVNILMQEQKMKGFWLIRQIHLASLENNLKSHVETLILLQSFVIGRQSWSRINNLKGWLTDSRAKHILICQLISFGPRCPKMPLFFMLGKQKHTKRWNLLPRISEYWPNVTKRRSQMAI